MAWKTLMPVVALAACGCGGCPPHAVVQLTSEVPLPASQPADAIVFPGWEDLGTAVALAISDAGIPNAKEYGDFRFTAAMIVGVDGGDLRGLASAELALDAGSALVSIATASGPFDAGQTSASMLVDTGLPEFSAPPQALLGTFSYSSAAAPPGGIQATVTVDATAAAR